MPVQELSQHRRQDLTGERNRLAARGELFKAVERGESGDSIFVVYVNHAKDILPPTIHRGGRQTPNEMLVHIFQKDQEVAKKFKEEGVVIQHEIVSLADLIKMEEEKRAEIEEQIGDATEEYLFDS